MICYIIYKNKNLLETVDFLTYDVHVKQLGKYYLMPMKIGEKQS